MVAPQLASKQLAYRIDCHPSLAMWADRKKVDQILLNLITNAIKFTERGEISVTCSCDGENAHIAVRDTGLGIDPERIESIFEPFLQLDSGYKRTSPGTGLGLTISRTFARGMGGDVRATSVAGEGSTFTLSLPSKQPAEQGAT